MDRSVFATVERLFPSHPDYGHKGPYVATFIDTVVYAPTLEQALRGLATELDRQHLEDMVKLQASIK